SRVVKPGSPPAEVEVTLCNDSAVSYPKVGVVLVLGHCTCAPGGARMARGTVERFDPATGAWIHTNATSAGTGTDYLEGFENVQDLPKGKTVTLRYRIALDATMTDGRGSVSATVVVPDSMAVIGLADLPFVVSTAPTIPSNVPTPSPRQSTLPLKGFSGASGMAADSAGNVYVADTGNNRVLELAAGSNAQKVLPFTDLKYPKGVAADATGNVYVTDGGNHRVVKLAAGSNTQTVVPFTATGPAEVAVDNAGAVYITDGTTKQVLKLAAGSDAQVVVPFTGLNHMSGLAADGAGNVFVIDDNSVADKDIFRVLKLAAGSTTQTELPFTGLGYPYGAAVDGADNVYVTDSEKQQVVKLEAGSTSPTVLPFTRLNGAGCVAVDGAGNVYVLDGGGFGSVVKLAAG
ncbi:MAG: serine/threonine protein kinase, bacterial, partial [Mycobacterium sp.]|nr:serine/threonine protein kinase, bacterial [Mycobacterium sp.]